MRKFRVWDVEEKCYQSGHAITLSLSGDVLLFGDKPKQDMYILEQSTGLLDKNGVEIFENDTMKMTSGVVGTVNYRDGAYYVGTNAPVSKCHYRLDNKMAERSEIIGTIHEAKG